MCQLWSVTFRCIRDGKPQRCIQQHKSLKVTQTATNRNRHVNEASKQTLANNVFKVSREYTQGKFSNRNICFGCTNLGQSLLTNLGRSFVQFEQNQ